MQYTTEQLREVLDEYNALIGVVQVKYDIQYERNDHLVEMKVVATYKEGTPQTVLDRWFEVTRTLSKMMMVGVTG